jgi:leucyl aminopeptidase
MEFFAVNPTAARERTDCAIIGVYEKAELSAAAADLDKQSGGRITSVTRNGDFRGKAGETLLLTDLKGTRAARIVLVGLGSKAKFGRKQYRKAIGSAVAAVMRTGAHDAVSYLSQESIADTDAYYAARVVAEVVQQALYRIPDLKSGKKPPAAVLKRFGIAVSDRAARNAAQRGLEHGDAISQGAAFAKDLGNLPANICTPTYLANAARKLARDHRSVSVRILNEPDMKRLHMGSFLSVAAGSDEPARLIVLEYRGGERGAAPVALVGKGVTFDTGGISIKPAAAMDEMKFDMGGAASVLGAFRALAEIALPINVVGVIPATENMPNGRATKPGDVVTSMSGLTIEVLNTDAEGRLILCDAITYARRYKPDVLIDIATLTGACVVALGSPYSGLFSNDEALSDEIAAAGQRADDRAWPMPMGEEYAEQLKSNFADIANVGGREAGAITAACFLGKFTEGLRWAHLDIAGTAWLGGAQKGGTGRPVPLLVDFLLHRARALPK